MTRMALHLARLRADAMTKPNEEITSVGETELATQFSKSIPRSQEPETAKLIEALRAKAASLVGWYEGETANLLEEAATALAPGQAAPLPNEWQPIETAPKDGTWFLICREDDGYDWYEAGRYDPMAWETYEPAEGDLYRKVSAPICEWRGFSNFHRATHWMPIPQPPRAILDRCQAAPMKEVKP